MHYDHKRYYCTFHINLNILWLHYFLEYRFISLDFKKLFQQEIVCFHKEKSLVEFENLSTSIMLKDSKTLGKKALEGFGVFTILGSL